MWLVASGGSDDDLRADLVADFGEPGWSQDIEWVIDDWLLTDSGQIDPDSVGIVEVGCVGSHHRESIGDDEDLSALTVRSESGRLLRNCLLASVIAAGPECWMGVAQAAE